MQQISFSYSPNKIQQLFVEKILESLYIGTLDSYRLRLHNPKTAIEELVHVTNQVKENILQRGEYVTEISNEVRSLIQDESDGLMFISISREYYKKIIEAHKKENYNKIIQSSKIVLKDNLDYRNQLIVKVKKCIDVYIGGEIGEPEKLLALIEYSLIELVNMGYTKQYLYRFLRTILVHTGDESMSFDIRFLEYQKLFNRSESNYTVIFKINSGKFQFSELSQIDSKYIQINQLFRSRNFAELSEQVSKFLEENKTNKLIGLKVTALDHYKAIEISRTKLEKDLDLYHLGFSGISNSIDHQAAVISEENPSKASTAPSNYQLEGFTRGDKHIFEKLLEKVQRLNSNSVTNESIEKLSAGFRYLRMGSEAAELETKMLNFWIGLEFVFTSFNSDEKSIDRIRNFFPVCHSLIYVRRNLYDFHKSLSRLKLDSSIDEYSDDLEYLSKYNTYKKIIEDSSSILLQLRAKKLQEWSSDPSTLGGRLFTHSNNLKWNISRLYRIRNEIVHNAATKTSISANVSHLKYYLTFILNSMLEFLSDTPVDIDSDGRVTIEDYFISQDIIFGSLKNKPIREYIKIANPIEMLF